MLAKKYRLNESKEFKRIQTSGTIFQSSSFGLVYLNREDELPSKFGFIVSTKIAKDAVDRNRLKRTMSEAIRTSMLDIKPGYDVVFLAKTSINKVPTDELMKETKKSLKEVGLMK